MAPNQLGRPSSSSSSRVKSRPKRSEQRGPEPSQQTEPTNRVLLLRQSQATFEPPTSKESVFFDECNREIINLTGGLEGKTRVLFQSAEGSARVEFLLPVEKRILSIKLNSTRSILAYHVEKSTIEFINITPRKESDDTDGTVYELENRRYQQSSRARNAKLSGFLWTGPTEMVMISDISVEYYHVDPQRHRLRHIKSFPSSTNWFVYQPSTESEIASVQSHSMLVVSTGSIGNSMQPYAFIGNQMIKLQRFEVEGSWLGSSKLELFERSITMASIYNQTRLLVLQHESLNLKTRGAQILIYTINCETGLTNKTHTLDLDINGRFALNVVDNLVIAHDQPSKSSFIFDIMIESTEKSDCPRHYVSLIDSQPIRPLEVESKTIQMYSLNWVFFQPNFIIDAKMGLLCTLHIDLNRIKDVIRDNMLLLTFLSHRAKAETIILNKIREVINKSCELAMSDPQHLKSNPLAEISAIFEVLANLVLSEPELEKTAQPKGRPEQQTLATSPEAGTKPFTTSISQQDIQRELFPPLNPSDSQVSEQKDRDCPHPLTVASNTMSEQNETHLNFVISILVEFILMVKQQDKSVDHCIYESLVKNLALGNRYFQIVQLIRAGILRDSKQLACVLLSLKDQYKPAAQMGLDMLSRLDCLRDLIESLNISVGPLDSSQEMSRRLSDALSRSFELSAA